MLPKRNEDKNYGFIFISSLLPLIINNFFSLFLCSVWFLSSTKRNVNKKKENAFFYIQLRDVFLFQHDTKGIAIGKDRENWVLIVGLLI